MKRKLLVLGDVALLDRVAAAGPTECDLVAAPNSSEARTALQTDPELALVLLSTAMAQGALAALKDARPGLQVILLTTDRALVDQGAALELGDVAALVAADASPAEICSSIETAFQRVERGPAAYPGGPARPPGDLDETVGASIATSSSDRVNMQEDWLEVLAHDLRTPLGINIGYTSLMLQQSETMDPDVRELLERMHSNGEWMLSLVDGMLDVARLKHGKVGLSREPVTLVELVTTAVERMRGMADPRGVRIEVEPIRDKVAHAVDRLRVEQVLHNLIGNAVKFSHSGSVVRVSARAGKGLLTFMVHDEGRGMNQEEAQRAFSKYSSHTGGRGLGLAIAREIVELHGGRIWVESEPDRGTTFRFTIVPGTDPRAMNPLAAPGRAL